MSNLGGKVQIKDREEHERRVLLMAARLEERLGLRWIDIKHHFSTTPADSQATTCDTEAFWKYRYAILTWNLNSVAACTDEQLKRVAVHEYVHVLMGPLKDHIKTGPLVDEMEEFSTESIARVIMDLLDGETL